MWELLFGKSKKETVKTTSPIPQQTEKKNDAARNPGDIEIYTFYNKAANLELYYEEWDGQKVKSPTKKSGKIDIVELENEKVISELMGKYSKSIFPSTPKSNRSHASSEGEDLSNMKSINETLKRIARYNNKRKIDERFGFASTIAVKAEEIGRINTIKFLLKAIDEHLSKDNSEIKSLILPQITTISRFIVKRPEGYASLIEIILPVVQRLLMDTSQEVSEKAAECLANLAELLTNDDRGNHILTIVLKLAHEEESVESRIAAIKLLNMLSRKFGKELCEQFVAFEIMCMADDPDQKVRKTTILNFLEVCETVSTEFFTKKLFPIYQKLAKDPYWPVRESAAAILADISNISPEEIRNPALLELFKEFHGDASRFVKKTALNQLGQLIYSLKDKEIPPFLMELYVGLADPKATDEDLLKHCAYTFPAVLIAVGATNWNMLKNTYKNMIKKNNKDVRLILAASIHEIAKLVGGSIAGEELDSIVKGFLNDRSTLQLILSHLHEFLAILDEKKRKSYVEILQNIVEKSGYVWRLRELFVVNAAHYAKLFDIPTMHQFILPIMYNLLQDNVIQVRTNACKQMYSVTIQLKSDAKGFGEAIDYILKLFSSVSFRDRQTFIMICEGFMSDKLLFDQYFLTQFLTLQKDKVMNVRLTMAKILHSHMKSSGVLADNIHISRTIRLLQDDTAKEVRESILEASKEWGKMAELDTTRQEELERLQEMAASNIDFDAVDEEEVEEQERIRNESYVKKTIKIDEMDESLGALLPK